MWYEIKFNSELITVTNTSGGDIVRATVSLSEDCSDNYVPILGPFEITSSKQIKLPFKNGLYKIKLQWVSSGIVVEETTYTYPYFGLLLGSLLEDMEGFFCDCDCQDCDDCGRDEKSKMTLMLKTFSYFILTYKYYPRFYDAIFKCLYCDILGLSNCELLSEKVMGSFVNDSLFKKTMANFYLSFYFIEYYGNDNLEEVNRKFKYEKISKCIKTANADIDCIKDNIENNMGVYGVQFGQYINLPPDVVGDFNTTAVNRAEKTCLVGEFTTLTTPPYHDPEGDLAQAIRVDTLPTNGALLTLDGVNVDRKSVV